MIQHRRIKNVDQAANDHDQAFAPCVQTQMAVLSRPYLLSVCLTSDVWLIGVMPTLIIGH